MAVAGLCAIALAQQMACADRPTARERERAAEQRPQPSAALEKPDDPQRLTSGTAAPASATPTSATPATALAGPVRNLIIGGGALPESTEVSLEQNVQLAIDVLPGPHAVFFAGGPSSQSVRVESRKHEQDRQGARGALAVRLGELFSPRKGRTSEYRASVLQDAARADLATLEDALRSTFDERAAHGPAGPLVVYIAAHGDQGDHPSENSVATWGNGSLTAHRIAELHDGSERELRMIVTSCYSGGFAELAFEAADSERGACRAPRCGLFAGTWDRETSGCDPDPDRSVQESYSQHLLHALARRDHKGAPLALETLDLDRDGSVSLLEAHTRARIASRSIDVPTSTSERFLREASAHASRVKSSPHGAVSAHAAELQMPEDQAVVRELGAALRLRSEAEATTKWNALRAAIAKLDDPLADAEEALNDAYWRLATTLLERFPVLDDPYHRAFAATLNEHAAAIEQLLESSAEAIAHQGAARMLDALDHQALELELQETLVLRLVRAHENLRLAARLHARGGKDWAHYQRLLACERRAW